MPKCVELYGSRQANLTAIRRPSCDVPVDSGSGGRLTCQPDGRRPTRTSCSRTNCSPKARSYSYVLNPDAPRVREQPAGRPGEAVQATGHSTAPPIATAPRGLVGAFLYAGLFIRDREGGLGLGACLVVGEQEQRHRWGGAGVQRPASLHGSTCAGAAVAGRCKWKWNTLDACMHARCVASARTGRRTRGPGQPDVRGTSSRINETGTRAERRLAWLASVGAVAVAASAGLAVVDGGGGQP